MTVTEAIKIDNKIFLRFFKGFPYGDIDQKIVDKLIPPSIFSDTIDGCACLSCLKSKGSAFLSIWPILTPVLISIRTQIFPFHKK
jgi:hypothetical protein